MNLEGKTAVVTGGSRGIGRAVCTELACQGANVVFCYTAGEAAARQTAAQCMEYGVQTLFVRCDVTKAEEVKNMMNRALQEFGRIDILVNNAGITRDGLLMKMREEDFDAVIDTNIKGAFLCMKEVSRTMIKQRYGRVINISSVVGLHGNVGQMNYAASKAGIIGMTKSMAKELGSRGITVNAVAPGFIKTDMTSEMTDDIREKLLLQIPAGRMGTAEDVAHAVAFLAGEAAGYITGQVLCVDGGMGM